MAHSILFPIQTNVTTISERFKCTGIDLTQEKFPCLQKMLCSCIFMVQSPSDSEFQRSRNDTPEHIDVYFILAGSIHVGTEKQTLFIQAGQVMIQPSWLDKYMWQTEDASYLYLRFELSSAVYPMEEILIRNCSNLTMITALSQEILIKNDLLPDEWSYRFNCAECLGILCKRELYPRPQHQNFAKTDILLRQLQHSSGHHWRCSDVADQLGMSPSAFRMFCIEHFKQTPSQLINQVRMSRALVMLKYHSFSISDIARQLGYADRYAFTKAFTRYYTISPACFRKQSK